MQETCQWVVMREVKRIDPKALFVSPKALAGEAYSRASSMVLSTKYGF